jgi:hypothetical protein
MLYAEAYKNLFYGGWPENAARSVAFRKLVVPETGLSIALRYGISLQEFRLYNADVKNLHRALPRGFWFAVPGDTDDDVTQLVEHVLSETKRAS